jgi:predicted RNase H-like HicB family nuclease
MTEMLEAYHQHRRAAEWHGVEWRQLTTSGDSPELFSFAPVDDDASADGPAELIEGIPLSLVDAYAERAVLHARVREVDTGVWIASVVGLEGAYGDGESEADATADLREAVVGWVAVRRRLGLQIPELEGLDLNVPTSRSAPV